VAIGSLVVEFVQASFNFTIAAKVRVHVAHVETLALR